MASTDRPKVAKVWRAGRSTCAHCRKPLHTGVLTDATCDYELPGGRNSIGDRRRSFNVQTVPAPYHATCHVEMLEWHERSKARHAAEAAAEAEEIRAEIAAMRAASTSEAGDSPNCP